jgi:HPt (histidine-containing phosphotransfer) domain-containing protein
LKSCFKRSSFTQNRRGILCAEELKILQAVKTINEKMEPPKITDLTYLTEASANNKNFLKEMIEIFLKQTPGLIAGLQKTSKEGDWAEFKKIMHKIKPSITMMGIHELESDIIKIDIAVKKGIDVEQLPFLLQRFEDVCNRSYEELRNELKSM